MSISNKVGPPVTGEDFYGRFNELAHAHEYLDTNHSLVLSAPRRIGKSSFAKRLVEDKASSGCLILNMIEHDGYIMRISGGIRRFHSPLLKKWWYSKFVE